MRIALGTVFVFVLSAAACGALAAQEQKAGTDPEQTLFREDEPFQHQIPLSPDVLKVLSKTKEARLELRAPSDSKGRDPAQLFRAAEVHLSSPDEVDLVVIGIAPMSGADNTWFWVVRSADKNPKVVLFAGANSLQVASSKTNGYRNISSFWSSASETRESIYHFDGKNYKVWKEKWEQNRY